jgi:hypothetical protein
LVDGAAVGANAVREFEHTVKTQDGKYALTGKFSTVRVEDREYRYLDRTRVVRE